MSIHSHYLPLIKVVSGMVLATDLLDQQGHILLPSGATLTDAMLRSLAHHEIDQLCVVKESVSEDEIKETQKHQLERLHILFRHASDNHATTSLKQYLQNYREGQTL